MQQLSQNPIFIKKDVTLYEYTMYKQIHEIGFPFVPKLFEWNEGGKTLKMQRIPQMSIADMYGERFEDVPQRITDEIRGIIRELYDNGIVYPDITGYNFIEDDNSKIWIIDFEHAFFNNFMTSYSSEKEEHLTFVKKFINGKVNRWNPWFA